MVKKKKKIPKLLNPGDMIISSDRELIGILQEKYQLNKTDNPFWRIFWITEKKRYRDVLEEHPYHDSQLRSEISEGYWQLFRG